jgi:hypothetical protein
MDFLAQLTRLMRSCLSQTLWSRDDHEEDLLGTRGSGKGVALFIPLSQDWLGSSDAVGMVLGGGVENIPGS